MADPTATAQSGDWSWLGPILNAAATIYGIKQGSKTPNTYPVPLTPEEQWITDAKKNLFGTVSDFTNKYMAGMGNLNPDFRLNSNAIGNPAFMGGVKVPSFSMGSAGGATPTPKSPIGGGMDPNDRANMKDPNAGGPGGGPDSTTPGGGPDPFAPGWMGAKGEGGDGSPSMQQMLDAAKKYGPGVLLSLIGGPIASVASLASKVYQMVTGKNAPTPTPNLGTQDTAATLGNAPTNYHPTTKPDLGLNADQGTLGDIFQHSTDATGAQQGYDFWNGLMNAPGQIGPDTFSYRVNPNIGGKR